MNPMVQLSKQY